MTVRTNLVYLRPTQVAFVRKHGRYENSTQAAWATMTDWLKRHGLRNKVNYGYSLLHDNPQTVDPQLCRYDACVQVPDGFADLRTDGLAFQKLPGGAFIRTRYVGVVAGLRDQLIQLRDRWMPTQRNLLVDRTRPFMIIHLDDPTKKDAAKRRFDICIPVKVRQTVMASEGAAPLAQTV
jgi:AraC family transcriptional regulator